MPEFGVCDGVVYLLFLLTLVGVLLLGVRLVSYCWHSGIPTKKEVRPIHKCRLCGREYTDDDVKEMLRAMGYGPNGDPVDEDYQVLIYGLCPACWPEYH